jgi:hypothetical protein
LKSLQGFYHSLVAEVGDRFACSVPGGVAMKEFEPAEHHAYAGAALCVFEGVHEVYVWVGEGVEGLSEDEFA